MRAFLLAIVVALMLGGGQFIFHVPRAASSTVCSTGTVRFVKPAATGTGTGLTWTDAMALSGTLTRGVTYCLADGSYSSRTYNTVASGTTTITIRKATVGDHGSSTGWDDTMGDGQAIWTASEGAANFTTDYWVFDGASGDGSTTANGSDISTYGFRFSSMPDNSVRGVVLVDNAAHVTVKHTAVQCAFTPNSPASDANEFGFAHDGDPSSSSFTILSYDYVDGCEVNTWMQGSDLTIEYTYFGRNWSATAHGVAIEAITRPIIRYNYFLTCAIQCIEPGGGATTDLDGGQIYGNIITNLRPNANNNNQGVTNGFIKGVSSGHINNTVIYNNVLYDSEGPILYESNIGGSTGNILRNNLCYLCDTFVNQDGALTHSHNWLVDSGSFSETGGQSSSGNPFISLVLGGFHLDGSPACNAGFTLSSPYTTDLYGGSLTATCASGFARGAVN